MTGARAAAKMEVGADDCGGARCQRVCSVDFCCGYGKGLDELDGLRGAENALRALRRRAGIIRLHGHRGMRGLMPENTMAGFAAAFRTNVRIVEADVLLTRDGIPVLAHDVRLAPECTRDGEGRWLDADGPLIFATDFEELRDFNIGGARPGSDYDRQWPLQAFLAEARVPRLADLCLLAQHPRLADVCLNIEVKSSPLLPELMAPPRQAAQAVAAVLRETDMERRVLVQSFDWRLLRMFAEEAAHVPRSYLSKLPGGRQDDDIVNIHPHSPWMDGMEADSEGGGLVRLIAEAGGSCWAPHFVDVDARQVREAREAGLIVSVWTVNEREDIARMIDLGVDGIITDYPARVQRELMRRGLHWLG